LVRGSDKGAVGTVQDGHSRLIPRPESKILAVTSARALATTAHRPWASLPTGNSTVGQFLEASGHFCDGAVVDSSFTHHKSQIRDMLCSRAVGGFVMIPKSIRPALRLIFVLWLLSTLPACALNEKRLPSADTSRLLTEDPMQGWRPVDRAPPVVGEYDVTFSDQGELAPAPIMRHPANESVSPPYRGSLDGECQYVQEPDRVVVVCPSRSEQIL
jgi:hypothetical protein